MFAAGGNPHARIISTLLATGLKLEDADADGYTPLYRAARFNAALEVTKALLAAGARVEGSAKAPETPLMGALLNNNPDVAATLLAAGAHFDPRQVSGGTVLLGVLRTAVRPSVLKALIVAGADAKAIDDDGSTTLMIAAASGSGPEAIRILVGAGAAANATNADGVTALMLCGISYQASDETVQALVAAGADVNAVTPDGLTPLMFALEDSARIDLVQALLAAGARPGDADKDGMTALMRAARDNATDAIDALLHAGADKEARDKDGDTALLWSLRERPSLEAARALLQGGARADVSANDGRTVLMEAVRFDMPDDDILSTLLAAGAAIEARDNNGETALMEAARTYSVSAIARLLAAGAKVADQDVNGRTALHFLAAAETEALDRGNSGDAQEGYDALLQAGADPQLKDREGKTALDLAPPGGALSQLLEARSQKILDAFKDQILYGTAESVDQALRDGASATKLLDNGQSPLGFSAESASDPGVLAVLVAHGADPNGEDAQGNTPLFLAFHSRHRLEMLRALIGLGADVNRKNKAGDTVISYSLGQGPVEELRLLLSAHLDIDLPDHDGVTPLMQAFRWGRKSDIIQVLLDAHPSIDARDHYGRTALMAAVSAHNLFGVRNLLDAGARAEDLDSSGWSPLMMLGQVEGQDVLDIIALLLSHGARAGDRDPTGRTALHHWMDRDPPTTAAVALLLAGGIDVEARDPDGMTPLMLACHLSSADLVRQLIAAGARVTDRNNAGDAPLFIALTGQWDAADVIGALLDGGASPNDRDKDRVSAIFAAIKARSRSAVKVLVYRGADLRARDSQGATPLIAAMDWMLDTGVVSVLLAAGADINAQDAQGCTALMRAGERAPGSDEASNVASFLFKAGADPRIRDVEGRTVLHLAASSRDDREDPAVLLAMIAAGLGVNDRDAHGMTPLMYAAGATQRPGVISALLGAGANAALQSNDGRSAFAYASGNIRLKSASPSEYEKLDKGRKSAVKPVITASASTPYPGSFFLGSAYDQDQDTTRVAAASSVLRIERGDMILAGAAYWSGHQGDAHTDPKDAQYIARVDAHGKIVWQREIGAEVEEAVFPSVVGGLNGTFYHLGRREKRSTTFDGRDTYSIMVSRWSENGTSLWTKNLTQEGMFQYPISAAAPTRSGDLLIASPRSRNGSVSLTVWRITPDGTIAWQRDFQGVARGSFDVDRILELADGSILLAGSTSRDGGARGAFLACLDAGGALKWSRGFTCASDTLRDNPHWSVMGLREVDGSILAIMTKDSTLLLARYAPDGTLLRVAAWDAGKSSLGRVEVQGTPGGGLMAIVATSRSFYKWKESLAHLSFDRDLRLTATAGFECAFGLSPVSIAIDGSQENVVANVFARCYTDNPGSCPFGVVIFTLPPEHSPVAPVTFTPSPAEWPVFQDVLQPVTTPDMPAAILQAENDSWPNGSLVSYATVPWTAGFSGLQWLVSHGLTDERNQNATRTYVTMAESEVPVRSAPRADAPVIAKLSGGKNTSVPLQNMGSMSDHVGDVDAPWYRVPVGRLVGWVFGAYVTEWGTY